jgi:endonuclease III
MAGFLAKLKRLYGDVASPEPRDPFELILWENAAYLVDDARRSLVFESLKSRVGVDAPALLAAGPRKIEAAIRDGGMQGSRRAEKVSTCARLCLEHAGGDLYAALRRLDSKGRRTLLKRFPGIADPGVAKVLLFAGLAPGPAIDSNGLRVLERLGEIEAGSSYAVSFRAGIERLLALGVESAGAAIETFTLLRQHGRELCKRTHPACEACPLRAECPYGSPPAPRSTKSTS